MNNYPTQCEMDWQSSDHNLMIANNKKVCTLILLQVFYSNDFFNINIKQNGTYFIYWESAISGLQMNKVEKKIQTKVHILFYLFTEFLQVIFLNN